MQLSLPEDGMTAEARTFPQLVRAAAAAYGDAVALTLEGANIADEAITFTELDSRSAQIARGMLARGIGKGSRVGFIQGNSPMFAVLLAAIARIGAVAVPISTLIKANELVRVLRQSDIAGLFVQRSLLGHDLVERLCDALPELRAAQPGALRIPAAPYLRWVVSWGPDLPSAISTLDDLTAQADTIADDLLAAVEAEVHPTDQMLEIYTSGSMALPKGVKHLHGPVVFRAGYLARMTERNRDSRTTATLPMFWVGGMGLFLLPNLFAGGCTHCTEGTSTSSRHAMGTVMAEEDLAVMAQAKPYWALGMSETFGPYAYGDELRAPGYPLCAPLDHIADGYEVRVANPETGQPVGDGEIGEIQVRGYALSPACTSSKWGLLCPRRILSHWRHGPGRRQAHSFHRPGWRHDQDQRLQCLAGRSRAGNATAARRSFGLCRWPSRRAPRPAGRCRSGGERRSRARCRRDRSRS